MDTAIAELERIIKQGGRSAGTHALLGNAWAAKLQPQAEQHLLDALALEAHNADTRSGVVYDQQGQLQDTE